MTPEMVDLTESMGSASYHCRSCYGALAVDHSAAVTFSYRQYCC